MNINKTRTVLLSVLLLAVLAAAGVGYTLMTRSSQSGQLKGEEFDYDQLNPGGLDSIAALTLPEARKRLNYLIVDTRDSLNNMTRLSNLSLKTAELKPPANDQIAVVPAYQEPIKPFTSHEVSAALAGVVPASLNFRQQIDAPTSMLTWILTPLDTLWDRAATPETGEPAQYRFKRVYFRDGSQQAFDELQVKDEDVERLLPYSSAATLATARPIDRVTVDVRYRSYPGYRKVVLDREHPRVVMEGGESYQLMALQDETAALLISTPKAGSYAVQGLDESGQALRSHSSNASPVLSDADAASLRALYDGLLEIQSGVWLIRDSQGVQDRVQQLARRVRPVQDGLKSLKAEYRYDVTPSRVEVFVYDPLQTASVEMSVVNSLPAQMPYIANDQKTGRAGFIDAAGNWTIDPAYSSINATDVPGVYRVFAVIPKGQSQAQIEYHYLKPGSQNLLKLPFGAIQQSIDDDLLLVQRDENGPFGIYSLKKQAFILPMKFAEPSVQGNIMVARVGDKPYEATSTYGAYTVQGKQLLAPTFGGASQFEQFIYTTSADRQRTDVYDLNGKKLNPSGTDTVGRFFDDQPLLVRTVSGRKLSFIGPQGNSLPIKLPYDDVQPFSNGLAVVRSNGLYGAIDLKGVLRIPAVYTSIQPFQTSLAAATLNGGSDGLVLIDKHNRIVKKLGPSSSYSVFSNSNDAQYTIFDTGNAGGVKVYDADGNRIDRYGQE